MLDRTLLRTDLAAARRRICLRGEQYGAALDEFTALDARRRETQAALDSLRAELNSASKQIGELMKSGKREEAEVRRAQAKGLSDEVSTQESVFAEPVQAPEPELKREPPRKPVTQPRPFPLPGATMQPPPEGAAS